MDTVAASAPPAHCPGTDSAEAGKASACEGCPNQNICASTPKGPDPDLPLIRDRMSTVKHKVLILSGKGGVGKSTFATQFACAMASASKKNRDANNQDNDEEEPLQVGLCDIDICGPSVPKMLGLEGSTVHSSNIGMEPVYVEDNFAVMSVGFLLADESEAVIWRGPKKNGLIKSFLKDVYWSDLDVLVFDTPPGTSDEHITVTQCLKDVGIDGAVLVTTPQAVACADVRREITFCRKVGIRILGLVENMSGYVCRKCGTETAVFRATEGGGEALAKETGVPFLGRVALDPALMRACDAGQTNYLQTCRDSPTAHALNDICNQVARTIGLDV